MMMMTVFIGVALVLLVVTLWLLLRPWQRDLQAQPDEGDAARNAALQLYREQLAELDRDVAAGVISDPELARTELQRRLLDDVHTAPAVAPAVALPRRTHRRTEAGLVITLPLAAVALYLVFGSPQALTYGGVEDPIDRDIATLSERLASEGGDLRSWLLLARSQRARDRLDDAERTYARAAEVVGDQPVLLVEHADFLVERAGGVFDERSRQLVARALAADPSHVQALAMAAGDALQRRDRAAAERYLTRMLGQFPPGSEGAQWVRERLTEIGVTVPAN